MPCPVHTIVLPPVRPAHLEAKVVVVEVAIVHNLTVQALGVLQEGPMHGAKMFSGCCSCAGCTAPLAGGYHSSKRVTFLFR